MKKLFLLFFLTPILLIAQDSTYIQYSSEATETFKPIKLVDEFETAFGMNEKVNFRLKAGLKSFDNLALITSKTWEVSGELGLGKRNSIKVNVYQKPTFALPLLGSFLMFDLEFRRYLNREGKVNALSGTYISFARTLNAIGDSYLLSNINRNSFGQNKYADERKLWKLDFGQQYGRFLDIGLRLGLKNVTLSNVNVDGFLTPRESRNLLPYLSSYSSINYGLDFPRNKRETDFCPFLNCNSKLNSLFKIDLSGMFYLDKFTQNIQTELSYEQKIGKLPLSISVGTQIGLSRHKRFEYFGTREIPVDYGTGINTVTVFSNTVVNSTQLSMRAFGELRLYPLQKYMVAKGKMVAGLQGPYIGVSYFKWLYDNRFYSDKLFNYVGDFPNTGIFSPVIGYQRKISKRHFIDVGLRFQDLSSYNIGIGNLAINPQFKFGYAF